MTLKVSVPTTRCFFGTFPPWPTPWHNRPSLLAYDSFQTLLYFGWRRSWIFSRVWPVSVYKTGKAKWMNKLSKRLRSAEGPWRERVRWATGSALGLVCGREQRARVRCTTDSSSTGAGSGSVLATRYVLVTPGSGTGFMVP